MTTTTMNKPPSHALIGPLYVLLAGLSWSFTGALLRLAPDLDPWQIQTWRGIGCAMAFVILSTLQGRRARLGDFIALKSLGIAIMLSGTVASIGFIVAIKLTTVANALFLSSCSPLLSAALGFLLLGERLTRGQIGAVALGLVGLLIIVGGGIEAGGVIGSIAALSSALGFAVASISMRMAPGRDFNSAMIAFGLLSAGLSIAGCVINGTSIWPNTHDVAIAFASGLLPIGLGFAFFLKGAPWVPAVGQTLLAQTETIFGPIWVWLAFGEQPAVTTLLGGAVIFIAVVGMAVAGSGRRRDRMPPHA